jgi:hypothetical protein
MIPYRYDEDNSVLSAVGASFFIIFTLAADALREPKRRENQALS